MIQMQEVRMERMEVGIMDQPYGWNGFYYPVIRGLRPGVYWTWNSALEAIGLENYHEKRGYWRKLASLEASLNLVRQFGRVVQEGVANNAIEAAQNPFAQQLMQQAFQAAYAEDLNQLREERERCTQLMNTINENLNTALEKITRLETQQQAPVSPRSSWQRVMDKLGNVVAGDNLGCQIVNGDNAIVYIRGKVYENPLAEQRGNEAAGFGVWFSDTSVWNVSSAWLEEFPLSKNNVEIVAALIAVKIAATFLGQKKLNVYTRSNFLADRLSAGWNTQGESHELLEMLKSAVNRMENVAWILISSQDTGIQNAKQLACRGATISED